MREDIAAEIQNLLSIPSWDWDAELEEALEKLGREYLKERGEEAKGGKFKMPQDERFKILVIGGDEKGEWVVGSEETKKQVETVKKLECRLQKDGKLLTWDVFDDPNDPRTLFQFIIRDRELRVDKKMLMADRPPVAVVTVLDGKAVRLEYYEGHDALALVYDLRAPELAGKKLPAWLESDPYAYDPTAFLEATLWIPNKGE